MANAAKVGQAARQKARERRVALEAEAKARNDRIENWKTEVFTGIEERDRASQAAASAEDAMADGLLGLASEGLTASEVADLCEMTQGEVTKLMKRRREAVGAESSGGSSAAGDADPLDAAGAGTPTESVTGRL